VATFGKLRPALLGAGLIGAVVAAMVGAGPAGALVGAIVCAIGAAVAVTLAARRAAAERGFADWCAARGWQPIRTLPAPLTTPLLRAGDERELEDASAGELGGRTAAAAIYVWHTVVRTEDDSGNEHERRSTHRHTVVQVVVGIGPVARLTIEPSGAGDRLFGGIQSWLSPDRGVELESTELADRFQLRIADSDDDLALRSVLTPAAIMHVLERLPGDCTVELEPGALVVSCPGIAAPAVLDAMADVAAGLADRVSPDPAASAMLRASSI
jgi:hypothetical protein